MIVTEQEAIKLRNLGLTLARKSNRLELVSRIPFIKVIYTIEYFRDGEWCEVMAFSSKEQRNQAWGYDMRSEHIISTFQII